MRTFKKSTKLNNVCYDIRGPVLDEATRLENMGERILKLNIGNPAPFGLEAPPELLAEMSANLKLAQGYSDSKGILPAREAVRRYCLSKGIRDVTLNDIYIGNGVSELIMIAMQGLLNNGDEVLVPAPDYPLWTAAINLAGGKAVHYLCDEQAGWYPDIADMERKITPNTKGIVIINPNNPTGAVYPAEILRKIVELAATHGLIVFSDEIYDRILYDDAKHVSTASLSNEILCITLNGISKSHRLAGFRAAWMVLSGNRQMAKGYIEGLNMLTSMRLCSNVPAQYIIPKALEGYQSMQELTKPGGRIREQRDFVYKRINEIPGLSCTQPAGAFYFFPRIDAKRFHIQDDEQMVLDLLLQKKVLLVQGTGFNWPEPNHFRVVILPEITILKDAFDRLESFLADYRQNEQIRNYV